MGVQKTIQQQEQNYKDNTATKQYNYKEIQQLNCKALANQLPYKETRHRKMYVRL